MDDTSLTNRRRFLEGAGLGGTALLAGCMDQLDLGDDGQSATDGTDGDGGAAAIVAIDQEAMREDQQAIRENVSSGEMNRTEAQQAMASLQEEYVSQALEALTGTVADADGVSVGTEYADLGAVTLEGDPAAILGLLGSDDVRALVSAADVKEQAQQRQGQ